MMVNVAAETECIKSYRFFDTFATFERLWWDHGGITFLHLLSGVEKSARPATADPCRPDRPGKRRRARGRQIEEADFPADRPRRTCRGQHNGGL